MQVKSARIIGIPAKEYWPQVFQHALDAGWFTAVFCIRREDDSETATDTRKTIIDFLQNLPFSRPAELSLAILSLEQRYKTSLESFVAGMFEKNNGTCRLLLWSWGQGGAYLKRGEKTGFILQNQEPKVVEGKAFPGDLFIFGTQSFFNLQGNPIVIHQTQVDDVAESLTPQVRLRDREGKAAACVVQCEADEGATQEMENKTENLPPKPNKAAELSGPMIYSQKSVPTFRLNLKDKLDSIFSRGRNRFLGIDHWS